ncbi:restriction endonuclease [Synergistaceae bacterium OttesenSCG-928-I11]|nr:restriction endonuclease [Synergistaceae bacterium OttesenSCG-928-I11]
MLPLPNLELIRGKYENQKEEFAIKFEKHARKHEILLETLDKAINSISANNITVDYSQLHDNGKSKYQKIIYSVKLRPFVWIIVQDRNLRMTVSLNYSDLDVKDKSLWEDIDFKKGKNHRGLGPEISFNDENIDVMRAIVLAFEKQLIGLAPTRTSNILANDTVSATRTKRTIREKKAKHAKDPLFENATPREFEKLCSDILHSCGWEPRTTRLSGDYGADVVAERDKIKIVIQCKKWQDPVGVKAPIEAIAGAMYYKADFAFVVTNSTYTNNAWNFSANTSVRLLHYSELKDINSIIWGKNNND